MTSPGERPARPALAYIRSWAPAGAGRARTGPAPVKAIAKALARAALSAGEADLFEINEAFAAMCVATSSCSIPTRRRST